MAPTSESQLRHEFYATKLRSRQLAFDIGANHGFHTAAMLHRGARVVAVEPQAKLAAELADHFPGAIILPVAVSDEAGRANLHLVPGRDYMASLDATWSHDHLNYLRKTVPGDHDALSWTSQGTKQVEVTTLDRLIAQYGEPTVAKIDTEGLDHQVLRGLSRPVDHILFEVHAARRESALDAFGRLEQLARYDYYGAPLDTWLFRSRQRPEEIISEFDGCPSGVGDVYARHVG